MGRYSGGAAVSAPERIWTNYREANRLDIAYDEPPRHPDDDCKDAYILVTAHEAAVAAARAEGMRSGIRIAASLAAAISLLDRGGKAAKKAAPSDAMFDQMLTDYRKSLTEWRAEYAEASK